TDLKVDVYPSGVVQALNGHLSDQTGTIVSAGLNAALNAAAVVAHGGLGAPPLAAPPPADSVICRDSVIQTMSELRKKQDTLNNSPASGAGSLSAADKANLQADIDSLTRKLTISARMRIDWNVADLDKSGRATRDEAAPINAWFVGVLPDFSNQPIDPSKVEV